LTHAQNPVPHGIIFYLAGGLLSRPLISNRYKAGENQIKLITDHVKATGKA